MKKMFKFAVCATIPLLVASCGNLSKVTAEGTTDEPVFPAIDKSVFNGSGTQKGSWVNWNNVRQIERGMNKDQLYHLIGRPHFQEGFYNVHEWDYVFNYRENGEHKVCQYKVLFDKDYNVNQQWWLPNGCGGLVPYTLDADFLFDFDKDTLSAKGKEILSNFATELKSTKAEKVHIVGYTDRLGTDAYNLDLSKRRANTVQSALEKQGVNAQFSTEGRGKADQVIGCHDKKGQAEKDCLRPNRRVVVYTEGSVASQENGTAPGHDGPAKVKAYQDDANKTSWK